MYVYLKIFLWVLPILISKTSISLYEEQPPSFFGGGVWGGVGWVRRVCVICGGRLLHCNTLVAMCKVAS